MALRLGDLGTPALVVEAAALAHNLDTMAAARPGAACRPHVKAHKSTALAREQAARGHRAFTGATVAELEGLARAGLGDDLLLANEVLDARRLGSLVAAGARVTVAVDSVETVRAAAAGGVREVLVDVDVGLPRCGCPPEAAGPLAEAARAEGLAVRGVMGYEGHVVAVADGDERRRGTEAAMARLLEAHAAVGGEVVSGGGTGTYDTNRWVTEVQAGSYALMDSAYEALGLPFRRALGVWTTVVSAHGGWAVADAGLKAFGMDHGPPRADGHEVWFCSDEHTTVSPPEPVGARLVLWPAHVDPTVAYHRAMWVCDGLDADAPVLERFPVDLAGW